MAAFNRFLPGMSKPRGVSRLRQGGFVRLSMCLARWGAKKKGFSYKDLFAGGLPGAHYETYNPDSLLQRRNLLTWTEDFSNAAWGKVAVTPTYNAAAAPDGSLTADLIAADGTASPHAITAVTLTTNPAQKTQSFYFKAGTGSFIQLLFDGNTGGWANFNLTNGTVSVQGTGVTAAITPDANGFFRCSMQDTIGTATGIRAAIVSGSVAARYEGNSLAVSVYFWGAQFELGAMSTYQKVTDWNTEYLAAAGSRVHMWQDNLRTVPVTAVEQTVGAWDDLSPNGKNATQATGGSRPKLSARYNLLTKTEQFSDAVWIKNSVTVVGGIAAPGGTSTASTLTATVGGASISQTGVAAPANQACTTLLRVKKTVGAVTFPLIVMDGSSQFGQVILNTNTGVVNVRAGVAGATGLSCATDTTDANWWLLSFSFAPDTSAIAWRVYPAASSDGLNYNSALTGSVTVAWPDMRFANDRALNQPAYQRVNTATDYDTAGFIHYLKFDGIDDSFQTPAIDFSGVNKMTVWLGTTRLSDAAVGIVVELSPGVSTSVGSFYIASPSPAATGKYEIGAKGSALNARRSADYFSPSTDAVTTQLASDAADSGTGVVMRFDGAGDAGVNQSSVASAGNFGNYSLNIGRRNNVSLPFNGRLTSLTVRGSTTPTSAAFIQSMEQYAAKLAGQTFTSA